MKRRTLWLLVIPYVGLLWVPFYNFREPAAFGIPFFYWYQFAVVIATALLTGVVYWLTRSGADEGSAERSRSG